MFFLLPWSKAGSPVAENYGFRNIWTEIIFSWFCASHLNDMFYATGPASVLDHHTGGNICGTLNSKFPQCNTIKETSVQNNFDLNHYENIQYSWWSRNCTFPYTAKPETIGKLLQDTPIVFVLAPVHVSCCSLPGRV